MTRLELLKATESRLQASGVEDARRNAEWMIEDVTGLTRVALLSRSGLDVLPADVSEVWKMVERRETGEPLQYILGHADFMSLRLQVTPGVLIPRPETEEVAEAALSRLQGIEEPWVLDIGTGSGALALSIQAACSDAHVFAADLSPEALDVATSNALANDLDVTFVCADALRPQFADAVPPMFDLIVSNPPYVPASEREDLQTEVRDHEPPMALFVDDDDVLLFYRAIAGHAMRLLKPGGWLVVETHADHGAATRDVLSQSGLVGATVQKDLSGRDRIAMAMSPPEASGARG